MSVASIASRRPRTVENWSRFPNQTKAIGSEESDEHVVLGDLTRFVENSDESMPRIAALMGVSDVVLTLLGNTGRLPMW